MWRFFFSRKLTCLSPENDSVSVPHHRHGAQLNVGQFNAFAVDFDFHALHKRDFHAVESHRDGPQPAEGQRVPRVVRDADRKGRIFAAGAVVVAVATIASQKIFAAPLKVEDAPVEGFVMRVAKHGANAVFLLALGAALALALNGLRAVATVQLGARP